MAQKQPHWSWESLLTQKKLVAQTCTVVNILGPKCTWKQKLVKFTFKWLQLAFLSRVIFLKKGDNH
jgi:hypothetical protein